MGTTRVWASHKRFEKAWGLTEGTRESREERKMIWELWKRLSDAIRTPNGGCDPYDLELLEETATWRLLSLRFQTAAAQEARASNFSPTGKANSLLETMARARARYRDAIHELMRRTESSEPGAASLSKMMQPIMEKGLPLVKDSLVTEEVDECVEALEKGRA